MDRTIRAVLAATTILVCVSDALPACAAAPAPPAPSVADAPVPPLGIGADAAQRIL